MLVGHFAAGMLAKRAAPQVSLGTLTVAAMLADVLGIAFVFTGLEHWRWTGAAGRGIEVIDLYDIALSHSLAMDVLWGLLAAGFYFWRRRDGVGSWAVFAAVLSHWVLDWISHRPDMPLAPAAPARLGLALWTSVPATLIVEGGLWVVAIVLYLRATKSKNWAGVYAFWPVVLLLTAAWFANITQPAPATDAPVTAGASASLAFFSLVLGWAYWMNRARLQRRPAGTPL